MAIEKGRGYGEVDPVMIDADLYGWALTVHRGGRISPDDRRRFDKAAKELQRSMTSLPLDAVPYYERLLELARAALRRALG